MLLPRGSLVTRFSSHPMHTVAGTTPSTQSGVLHPVRVLPERDLKLPRGGGVPGQAALSALRCARWSRAFLGRGSRNAAPCSSRTWSLWETPPLGPLPSLLTQKVGGPEGSTPHVPPPEVPMHTRAGEAGARAGAGKPGLRAECGCKYGFTGPAVPLTSPGGRAAGDGPTARPREPSYPLHASSPS